MATKKIQILDSMIKQAENANTLGGRSASYFAVASEVNELQQLVGDTSVSTQISTAVESITADDLGVYVQDTEPTEAVEGDIWIDSSADSGDYVPINHAHNDATASASGFMSAADKVKLDSLVSGNGGDSGVYVQNEEPTDAEDGTLWVDLDDDGDIDIETPSINIDTTLTVEGYAADAKATGDAINQVSTRVGSTSVSSQISTAVNEHARKAAPINLLDNSDFTHFVCEISTHGEQEYAGDRWILDSGEFDCWNRDPSDWYASDATLNGTIRQIVSNPPDVGTVVIEMISGTADASYVNGEVIITSSGGMIKNVALYEGEYTDNTIPEYNPKGYTNELRECQRYGCSIQGGTYAGVGGNGGSYVYIPLPVKLRNGQIGYNLYYEGEIISTSGSVTPTGISISLNDVVSSGGIYIYVSHNENLSGPIVWDKPRFAFYIDTQSTN